MKITKEDLLEVQAIMDKMNVPKADRICIPAVYNPKYKRFPRKMKKQARKKFILLIPFKK